MPPKKLKDLYKVCTNCHKRIIGHRYVLLVPVDREAMYVLYVCKDCNKRLIQRQKDEEEFGKNGQAEGD